MAATKDVVTKETCADVGYDFFSLHYQNTHELGFIKSNHRKSKFTLSQKSLLMVKFDVFLKPRYWMGNTGDGARFTVIDTPGFGDRLIEEEKTIESLVQV